jgi:AcrR family transcriptional regulator
MNPADLPLPPHLESPSRRERRKLEVRTRILEAAAALFGDQGFHATKVSEICERADVAHKTFFNHFPTKQHVVRELASYGIEQLLVDIETARKEGLSTRDRLLHFFGQISEMAGEAGPMHRELLTEIIHAAHASAEPNQALRLRSAFGAIVNDGLTLGDVTRRHDPDTLTEMILGAYYVLMFNWANLEDYPIHKQACAAARFLADALAPLSEED